MVRCRWRPLCLASLFFCTHPSSKRPSDEESEKINIAFSFRQFFQIGIILCVFHALTAHIQMYIAFFYFPVYLLISVVYSLQNWNYFFLRILLTQTRYLFIFGWIFFFFLTSRLYYSVHIWNNCKRLDRNQKLNIRYF